MFAQIESKDCQSLLLLLNDLIGLLLHTACGIGLFYVFQIILLPQQPA
jgi:hypothetical protein